MEFLCVMWQRLELLFNRIRWKSKITFQILYFPLFTQILGHSALELKNYTTQLLEQVNF